MSRSKNEARPGVLQSSMQQTCALYVILALMSEWKYGQWPMLCAFFQNAYSLNAYLKHSRYHLIFEEPALCNNFVFKVLYLLNYNKFLRS